VYIFERIGSVCLSAILLWGVLFQLDRVFASDAEQELRGNSPALTIYNQQFAVVR
jgi:hypothetical protein